MIHRSQMKTTTTKIIPWNYLLLSIINLFRCFEPWKQEKNAIRLSPSILADSCISNTQLTVAYVVQCCHFFNKNQKSKGDCKRKILNVHSTMFLFTNIFLGEALLLVALCARNICLQDLPSIIGRRSHKRFHFSAKRLSFRVIWTVFGWLLLTFITKS